MTTKYTETMATRNFFDKVMDDFCAERDEVKALTAQVEAERLSHAVTKTRCEDLERTNAVLGRRVAALTEQLEREREGSRRAALSREESGVRAWDPVELGA